MSGRLREIAQQWQDERLADERLGAAFRRVEAAAGALGMHFEELTRGFGGVGYAAVALPPGDCGFEEIRRNRHFALTAAEALEQLAFDLENRPR